MWTEITADQKELLARYFEIMSEMDHRNEVQTAQVGLAQVRSSVARRVISLFHYQGAKFDVVMRFQFKEPRRRYFVCFGFLGEVTPNAVLDLIYEKGLAFALEHAQTEFFAAQRPTVDYPPMQQVFDLAFADPRMQIAVVTELSDGRVLQIRKGPAP